MSNMETKMDEVRFKTSDPEKMQGMYLAEDLYRRYKEDFVDEDTGETVSMERSDLLIKRGELIQGDISSQILFYLQTGEIREFNGELPYPRPVYWRYPIPMPKEGG